MLELKCYWAGMLVLKRQAQEKELSSAVNELVSLLKGGEIVHLHVGTTFIIQELLVDVYKDGVMYKFIQLKK